MVTLPTFGPWIDWPGRTKKAPLPAGTDHEVRFRDGTTARDNSPETWTWKAGNGQADIVAYRRAK